MKILKILNSNDEGGVLQAEIQYLKELRGSGVNIHSVIIGNGRNKELYEKLSDMAVFMPGNELLISGGLLGKSKSLISLLLWSKNSMKLIPSEIKNKSYNAIVFGRISFVFLSYFLAKKNKIKNYHFVHNTVNNSISLLAYKIIFKLFSVIPLANSEFTKQKLKGASNHIFYPGYDMARIAQSHAGKTYREEYGLNSNTLVLGIAARVCEFKAQDVVVKALMDKQFEKEDFVLFIAGVIKDKAVMERIKIYAGEHYRKKIIYLGDLSKMSKFYASIDILLNSGKGPESFGISVVEAMASGLPVVALSVGGTAETVQDSYNGWSYDEFSLSGYTITLKRVFEEKYKIDEYGKNSMKASSKFSSKENVINFINLIKA